MVANRERKVHESNTRPLENQEVLPLAPAATHWRLMSFHRQLRKMQFRGPSPATLPVPVAMPTQPSLPAVPTLSKVVFSTSQFWRDPVTTHLKCALNLHPLMMTPFSYMPRHEKARTWPESLFFP